MGVAEEAAAILARWKAEDAERKKLFCTPPTETKAAPRHPEDFIVQHITSPEFKRAVSPQDFTVSEKEERQRLIRAIRYSDPTGLMGQPEDELWERNPDLKAIRDANALPYEEREGNPVLERQGRFLTALYRRTH